MQVCLTSFPVSCTSYNLLSQSTRLSKSMIGLQAEGCIQAVKKRSCIVTIICYPDLMPSSLADRVCRGFWPKTSVITVSTRIFHEPAGAKRFHWFFQRAAVAVFSEFLASRTNKSPSIADINACLTKTFARWQHGILRWWCTFLGDGVAWT